MKHAGIKSLPLNICANFFGKGVSGLLGVFFIPLYTRIIGIESLGIIALFASVQGMLAILDMGLSATMNRELALASSTSEGLRDARHLVRTLEWIYWGLALAIGLVFAALSPLVAHWVRAGALSPSTITFAGMLLAVQLAVQFPQSLYTGGLQGLEKQVLLNGIAASTNIARHVGVLVPLLLIKPDIIVFVTWQILVIAAGVLVTRHLLWKSLSQSLEQPRFSVRWLKKVRHFSIGVAATAVVTIPLTTLDKLIMSRILPLDMYGYYMLAWQGAAGLGILITPFFNAFFPRFTSILSSADGEERLTRIYATACQLLSVILAPAAASAILFARPLTEIWLHSNGLTAVAIVAPILAILLAGSYCNGLMHLPYALILARGQSHFAFYQNTISLVIYLPLIYFLTKSFGAAGAASCWVILNLGYVVISSGIVHRWFLTGRFGEWMQNAVIIPTVVAFGIASVCYWLTPQGASPFVWLSLSVVALGLGVLALALLLPDANAFIKEALGAKPRPQPVK